MNFSPVINALALPPDSNVNQRVPKKLLLEQGAPTSADKRQIQDGIEEILWVAALKPNNIGVPAFQDELREYLEIAILTVLFRPIAKQNRLVELIHRAIPYPLLLLDAYDNSVSLSLAHKRWSQGEKGKVVIEEVHRTIPFQPDVPKPAEVLFLTSLTLSSLPSCNLFSIYQAWIIRLAALEAAQITDTYALPDSADSASTLRNNLDTYAKLQHDIVTLQAQAKKEKQVNRRVEINIEIKRLETELSVISKSLIEKSHENNGGIR